MRATSTKILAIIVAAGLVGPVISLAQNSIDPAFNPGLIIPDEAFADVGTFGSAEGIQRFLEQKGSVLANTTPEFLVKLKEPDTLTKVALEDIQPNLTRLRTAAELIYDAGTKWGLNPQVLLVMLQKEQSLINGTFSSDADLQRALDRAVGFGCPDYEGCGDIFLGFYRQIFGTFDSSGSRWLGAAASLMRSFRAEIDGVRVGRGPMVDSATRTFGRPVVRTARKGDTIILDNTPNGYIGVANQQSVTLGNFATAALYRYTPHVFNGNYNFWKFYSTWFKYPNGTVIQKVGEIIQYVVDNGTKRPFSAFVATQRGIKLDNVILVSPTEFDSYLTEKPMPPTDGTLIKGDMDATVFLVGDSTKHPISGPVFLQRKLSFAKVITLPQAEVDSYSLGSFEAPLDQTLIVAETDATVYIIDTGLKRPISGAIFKARGLSFAKIMKLSDTEVVSLPTGPFLTPPEKVAIKTANDPTIWWFRDNLKRQVSAFVYKQRGVNTFPHLVLSDQEILSIPTGNNFPPADGTVFKGDATSAIYKMENGLKRLLTAAAYKRLGYPRATVLPQNEVDQYMPGDDILK
ncbi:MAG: hypothetical protein A2660_03270 [Candidatus Doudnabacteria bacterium RIFCSPHIGHO2_01_FULL_45_18]|uniref:Uncharacterized protein n=1 Tax=Candidatus Doudnabacteria bacterium RIFCSPHIGHO2_01_FULL_45_18 TaxID=1817823 RepID=A0A1F5NQ57_9BACT|nr:MAG: hypothetical protein A2660_03270 [Candidatus Doudnabacteria bacterium RIFCSPHIGHO2_01_FULL_45_18]